MLQWTLRTKDILANEENKKECVFKLCAQCMHLDFRRITRTRLSHSAGGCRSPVPHVMCNCRWLVLWVLNLGIACLFCPRLATSLISYRTPRIAVVTPLVASLGCIILIHRAIGPGNISMWYSTLVNSDFLTFLAGSLAAKQSEARFEKSLLIDIDFKMSSDLFFRWRYFSLLRLPLSILFVSFVNIVLIHGDTWGLDY